MASRRIIALSLLYSHRRQAALFKSKFEDLMTSSSRKWFSSNSPSPLSARHPRYNMNVEKFAVTQPPTIQLEVNPEDPLARFNDEINEKINAKTIVLPQNTTAQLIRPIAHLILVNIVDTVSWYDKDILDQSYMSYAERESLFEKYEALPKKILDARKDKDFKSIRTLRILQKNASDEDTAMAGTPDNTRPIVRAFVNATKRSWNYNFIGPAASALWHYIMHYYGPSYAKYVEIVQSSGTGKSRTIDELSKSRLTIPLCLRPEHIAGYPYADDEVRDFLTRPQNRQEALLHAVAFLLALFEHTEITLRSEFHTKTEYSDVAASFRQYMMTSKHTSKRRTFFRTVVANAKKYVYECSSTCAADSTIATVSLNGEKIINRVYSACKSLTSLLETKYPSSNKGPILLITWDEVHTLTNKVSPLASWSYFTVLRRVLDYLITCPIFSIFSSTTSKMSRFPPTSIHNDSSRAHDTVLDIIPPFCDLGFDLLATKKVSLDAGQTLDEFTTIDYMCRLGRPLFGSHYDYGYPHINLLESAAGKLVKDVNLILNPSRLSPIQKIACLSFRLPIQFKSTVYASRDSEESLVEDHMRICLEADITRGFMNTHSASEPFMSEAAYSITNRLSLAEGRKLAIEAFRHLTEGFAIDSGDQGEFLALLLCTLARDSTVAPTRLPNSGGGDLPLPKTRHFGLAKFLCNNLIHNRLTSDESKANLRILRSDFPRAVLHFNHFIKAHQQSVITRENLLLLMARGAGVLSANCQHVNFILPFLVDGLQMKMNNSGLILGKVTNDSRYGADIQEYLFKHMDPYELHILEDDQAAAPMVRIVFALASATPSVQVIRREPSNEYGALIYDIWVAGITPDVLRPIDSDLQDMWEAVLQASYGRKHVFDATSPEAKDMRMSMDAGSAQDDGHWNRWSER